MKKTMTIITALLCLSIMTSTVNAQDQIPYKTYTESITGQLVETQIAYEPVKSIQTDLEKAAGFAYDEVEEVYYISDEESASILKLNLNDQAEHLITSSKFKTPQGLFVDDKYLYVADEKAGAVFVLDKKSEEIIQTILKPEDPLYGIKQQFRPTRVVVSKQNVIYVLSKGNSGGLIRFNLKGEFMGYFASNESQTGFFIWLKDKFFTEKQKAQFFKNIPSTPSSMSIDGKGLVYTVTRNLKNNGFKKFNAAGINLAHASAHSFQQFDFSDVDVDDDGNIYTLFNDGTIYVFNPDGYLFFMIKSPYAYQSLKGQVEEASNFHVDKDKNIHVLDQRNGNVQIYHTSEYSEKLYSASVYYQDGLYREGESEWDDVRRQNAAYRLPYQALAKANFQNGEYKKALDSFELANDKFGYSNAFWEIRNTIFQDYLGIFFAGILILSMFYLLFKKSKQYKRVLGVKEKLQERYRNTAIARFFEPLRLSLEDPREAFYQVRYFDIMSIKQANSYFVIAFVIYLSSFSLKAFLFKDLAQERSFIQSILTIFIPLITLILSNYLVSTIQDGEGRFKDVYTSTSLILAPYIFWAVPIYLVSNVLSLNEAFLFEFLMFLLILATVYRLLTMVQEIHNYSFKQTINNLFLTLFTAVMLALFAMTVYIFSSHLLEVMISIIKEVVVRA